MITMMTIPAMSGTMKEKAGSAFWTILLDSMYIIPMIWDFIK
jgi:hypothetical protein